MRILYLLLFGFLLHPDLLYAQAYETIISEEGDISIATLHVDGSIYIGSESNDSIMLGKIGYDNSYQSIQHFKKPTATYKCQKMISLNSDQIVIAGISYDTIIPMRFVRFEMFLHVFNTSQNKIDTVIQYVISDSSCIQEVRKQTPMNVYAFHNEIYVLHQFHSHIDGDTLTPYYSHASILKVNQALNLQYAHTHRTNAHTNTIQINSVLNQLHFENNRIFFVYELQNKILPERYVIIDSLDDSGYIHPYDSIIIDEPNHSMFYIQNNQFYLKRLDTYYAKANNQLVPKVVDLVGKFNRETASHGIPGEASALLPIYPPYDSTYITSEDYPLTFTETSMLYIRNFQTLHHANTVFIMTDTSLKEIMNVNAKDLLISNKNFLQVVPLNQDSFVLIGSFYNAMNNRNENHSYLITSKRYPIQTGHDFKTENDRQVKIYPNPTNRYFHLMGIDVLSVKLTDILGRQFDVFAQDGKFDISQLPSGFYSISKADGTFIGRFSLAH